MSGEEVTFKSMDKIPNSGEPTSMRDNEPAIMELPDAAEYATDSAATEDAAGVTSSSTSSNKKRNVLIIAALAVSIAVVAGISAGVVTKKSGNKSNVSSANAATLEDQCLAEELDLDQTFVQASPGVPTFKPSNFPTYEASITETEETTEEGTEEDTTIAVSSTASNVASGQHSNDFIDNGLVRRDLRGISGVADELKATARRSRKLECEQFFSKSGKSKSNKSDTSSKSGKSKSSKSDGIMTASRPIGAPFCPEIGTSCTSGSLLNGAGQFGSFRTPDEIQPHDTIDRCRDPATRPNARNRSIEKITVSAVKEGHNLRAGQMARIDAVLDNDRLDGTCGGQNNPCRHAHFYYTSDIFTTGASTPDWTLIGTKRPVEVGLATVSVEYELPPADVQAVRVVFRSGVGGINPRTCPSRNDVDDLVFAVAAAE